MLSMLQGGMRKRKSLSLTILLCVLVYIGLRIHQGFSLAKIYFQDTWKVLSSGMSIPFSDRVNLEGARYLYSQKIVDTTPENSTICFYKYDPTLGFSIAAYYIYPRMAKPINQAGTSMIDEIILNRCTYIFLNDGFPDIDLKSRSVVLFGKNANDQPVIFKTNFYYHNNYRKKIGLIEL
jgi:hypothetical protein